MAELSAVIMAHPSRREMVAELQASLDREVDVVWDQHDSLWDTGRRSLLAYDRSASHHLVIQDDAIVCRDLLAGTERACAVAGEHPVSLYAGMYRPTASARAMRASADRAKDLMARAVQRAEDASKGQGTPWMEYEGPWWGVALVVPTAHIPDLVRWGDSWTRRRNYDARIGQWYNAEARIRCWYTMPSLVDHRVSEGNPSLIGNDVHVARETGRVAHWFIGRDRSALEIDWDRPPLGIRAYYVHVRTGTRRSVLVGGRRWEYLKDNPHWREVEAPDAAALAGRRGR